MEWLCQVFHHTASNKRSGNTPALGICTHGRGGDHPVVGPLCNALVARDGTWYVVASGAANHPGVSTIPHRGGISSGVKYYALGWECENDGIGEPWPAVQLASIEIGEAAVADHLGWRLDTSEVFGHKEIARPKGRKIDPAGIDMDQHRAAVGRRRGHTTQPTEEPLMVTDEDAAEIRAIIRDELAKVINPDGRGNLLLRIRDGLARTERRDTESVKGIRRLLGFKPKG